MRASIHRACDKAFNAHPIKAQDCYLLLIRPSSRNFSRSDCRMTISRPYRWTDSNLAEIQFRTVDSDTDNNVATSETLNHCLAYRGTVSFLYNILFLLLVLENYFVKQKAPAPWLYRVRGLLYLHVTGE